MKLSHWASPKRRSEYEQAYRAALGLWPIRFEDRYVETPFGSTHVVVSGDPDGEPLVLIHAASLSATQWYLQAADFGTDHRLYAVDIMGDIGLSTQTAAIHTRDDAAAWLAAVLDGLGLARPTFIGSSFGGFHSTNLAVARPDRVGALVLLAPAATILPFRFAANLMIRAGSLVPLPFTVRPGLRAMMSGGAPDGRIVDEMEAGVAGFRYDRAGIYPSELTDDELSSIACPTLVLLGDKEMIYDPVAAVARVRRLVPRIDTEIVQDVGHLLGMQRPGFVNRRIRTFLTAQTVEAPGGRTRELQPA